MMHSPLLMLGILIVTGLLFSLFATRTNIPRIASYALAGLVWSEDLLGGVIGVDMTSWSGPLTDAALAFVAYLIGGSVTAEQLQRLGKVITLCTVGEVTGAFLLVTFAIWIYLPDMTVSAGGLAIVLGTLAASTAPAATVAVIHQYRSKGPLTTTLLGVVALDDAFGIILFSLVLVAGSGLSLVDATVNAGTEILGALILGIASGSLLAYFGNRVRNHNFFLPMVVGALLLSQGVAEWWHFSPLLTAMAMGFSARATYQSGGERLFAPIEYLEELVFLIFFTFAGAHFKLSVFMQSVDLIFIYIVARVLGKLIGVAIAARASHAPEVVTKYLGLGVVPQAGIAIGLALSLLNKPEFSEIALLVLNIILASTIIYEVIGPLATRYAIFKAGEASLQR